jgi:ABC-type transport system substrate-binding protein
MKFPSLAQWKHFFKILSRKEKIAFFSLVALSFFSLVALVAALYRNHTVEVAADNGFYIEGAINVPRFLNPVYADSNGTDQDITQLLFSGLLDYDENGQVTDGLADYKISDDGKTYEFILKNGLFWSDGEPITSDDAIYTIKIIQDPAYKSPLRSRWIGVETEKISDMAFRLRLNNPYASFLENCTLKIIPKHSWQNLSAESFPLSPLNLDPIVSGPYKVMRKTLAESGAIESIDLERNPKYIGKKTNLARISFAFFSNYSDLATAFKRGQIQGFVSSPNTDKNSFSKTDIHTYSLPRYYAIFFNAENNNALNEIPVRAALTYATNKQEILDTALGGAGKIVETPFTFDIYGIEAPTTTYDYNPDKAAQILDDAGYKLGEDGLRSKTVSRQHAFQFTKNLAKGSTLTADVKELQKCLSREIMPGLDINGSFGDKTVEAVKLFQEKYRKDILDPQNLTEPSGDVKLGTREKLNSVCFPSGNTTTPLTATLTIANQIPFTAVAETIKTQWAKIGISVNINAVETSSLERDVVKPRSYEALLFGQALEMIPDPYPFWHSTQKVDPGLNFSLYENKDADKLLEEIRTSSNQNLRNKDLASLQELIAKDAPAIFLYNPDYIYIVSKEVKGIATGTITEPSRRFADIAGWYTATKRIWIR